jgi:hypothetical protein
VQKRDIETLRNGYTTEQRQVLDNLPTERYEFELPGGGGENQVSREGWQDYKNVRDTHALPQPAVAYDTVHNEWEADTSPINELAARQAPSPGQQLDFLVHRDQMKLQMPDDYTGLSEREFRGHAHLPMGNEDGNHSTLDAYHQISGEDDAGNKIEAFHKRSPFRNRE